ncbi:hypothetical protein MKOR_32630 [Mycolicibacillus koreensis]|nr:hypothetical protein MKOR_32630 [Mycolicibacillus koreensis]
MRDRQRQWCPRCRGALLAPQAPPAPVAPAVSAGPPPMRLPSGFRWIAVRPGAPPRREHRRPPLGPTPRYPVIPRWSLDDRWVPAAAAPPSGAGSLWARWSDPDTVVADATLRRWLRGAAIAVGAAAIAYAAQYLLLIINRSRLLHPAVSAGGVWLPVLAGSAALVALIGVAVVATQWLVARRRAAFDAAGRPATRSAAAVRWGCLVPVVNLFWAPVFLIELARLEGRERRLRAPIRLWWIAWAVTTGAALFATATRWVRDAQGIANNIMAMVVTYLLALLTLWLLARVHAGFGAVTAARPAHRWVVVDPAGDTDPPAEPPAEPPDPAARETLEPAGSEPAA